jgi:hypothetical protein
VHVGLPPAEGDEAAGEVAQAALEQWLVARHDEGSLEAFDDLGLGGRDVLQGAHQLEVDGSDVGDHAHVGARDARQGRDLAPAAHGELRDHDLRPLLDVEQRQRHTDLVVEVARRGHGVGDGPQQRRQDVLGRGLAGAAGDSHHPRRAEPAHVPGQAPECEQAVVDDDLEGPFGQPGRRLLAHDRGRRAGLKRGAGEAVAVEALPLETHEQGSRRDGAAVGRHALDEHLGGALGRPPDTALEAAAAGGRDLGQRERYHLRPRPSPYPTPASASSATSRSSKGIFWSPTICPRS